MNLPEHVLTCIRLLNEAGFEAYAVGGAIRDVLLGKEAHDYDLTTDARPEEMQRVFQDYRTLATGLKHGTLTVLIADEPLEITTYRIETDYSDHRHPDHVTFTSALKEDCARRDFTINALAYHPEEGLQDFFHGQDDLQKRILRAVGDPDKRFEEDALRILRAVRFTAQLSFTIEPNTAKAIHRHISDLQYVSMERIENELQRILEAPGCTDAFRDYRDLFEICMPLIHNIPAREYTSALHKMKKTDDPEMRMACLLEPVRDQVGEAFFRQLKCSGTFAHNVLAYLRRADFRPAVKVDIKHMMQDAVPIEKLIDYCMLNEAPAQREILYAYLREIRLNNECVSLAQLTVNGKDLQNLGYRGKDIGDALAMILEEVMQDRCANTPEAIYAFLKKDKH